jgi:hypothetical protein
MSLKTTMVPGATSTIGSVESEIVPTGVAAGALLADLHQQVIEQGGAPNRKRSGVIQSGPRVSYSTVR